MRRYAAIGALAILGACTNEIDQSTRPENVAGTYRLTSYGGKLVQKIGTLRKDGIIH